MVRLLYVCILTLSLVSPAFAGDVTPVLNSEVDFLLAAPTNVNKDFRMEAATSFVGGADFSNGLGRVNVTRASLAADYSIFHLSYVLSHFDWQRKAEVARTLSSKPTVTPWDNLHDITLQARLLNNTLGERWRYWVNGELTSSFEEDWPGAVGVGFDGGVAYDFWQGWMLGVSAKTIALSALNQDLFGEVEFGIALAVSQKTIRNTLKYIGLFKDAKDGREEIGFNFAWNTAEKTYRLSSHNPVQNNGYLGLVHTKVGFYLDYKPREDLIMTLGPEYHYNRKYKLYNSTGSYRSSHNLENAWGGFARIKYIF